MVKESNATTLIISLSIFIIGLMLIITGQAATDFTILDIKISGILSSIGTFAIVVIVLQFLYDHYVREAQFKEIASTIIKSSSV